MGEKKRRQEIFEKNYDEFLGQPDTLEEARRGINDHKYPVLSGNEGMHDVIKYVTHLDATAEKAGPVQLAQKAEKKVVRPARTDHLAEQLVHPDYTDDSVELKGKYTVVHGNESIQNGDEQGWH